MDTKTESGRRLKAAREALDMTLKQVCDQVSGLLPTTLSNWENGARMIGVDEAKRLAPVLKVSAGYLLTLDDSPGDPREQSLLELYRDTDERGKAAIHRVAEAESNYPVEGNAA